MCRLLHWPLSYVKQPRVIAEVLGGIILGPTVLGHIPNFSNTLFPAASMPTLNLVANLGLVLFLFLVGLEVDLRMFGGNWRVALAVGALGMTLPFGLGIAVAWGLYNQFASDPGTTHTSFGVFALFIGVAMAITAFPVLARILTELKLLSTPVGVIVLSAGVGNDVVGWVLLALTVALVNAGSGLSALYVLLVCIGWVLVHAFIFRPILRWVVRKTGSDSNGPTQPVVAFVLLMVLASAFFTGIIGVHPIFGGFLVGLICPHENGFKSKMTEKIEDLVSVLFLPIYFALSGLKTDIGLLNDGITWAYVIAVLAVAFVGKIGGGTIAAKCSKLVWRESFTIGVLMSCKGLVELIVLNIGLSAGIISKRVFTIFVVMALVTTFVTTPVTAMLYPPWYQEKMAKWREGKNNWDDPTSPADNTSEADTIDGEKRQISEVRKLMVYLRLDSLPAIFTFIGLLGHSDESPLAARHNEKDSAVTSSAEYQKTRTEALVNRKRPLEVHGVRMLELSERISTVMKDLESSEYPNRDPVINVFRSFSLMNSIAVSAGVTVTNQSSYADTLQSQASQQHADLLLIPWSETGNLTEEDNTGAMASREGRFSGANHNHFIAQTMNSTSRLSCDTAIFVNRGLGGADGLASGSTTKGPDPGRQHPLPPLPAREPGDPPLDRPQSSHLLPILRRRRRPRRPALRRPARRQPGRDRHHRPLPRSRHARPGRRHRRFRRATRNDREADCRGGSVDARVRGPAQEPRRSQHRPRDAPVRRARRRLRFLQARHRLHVRRDSHARAGGRGPERDPLPGCARSCRGRTSLVQAQRGQHRGAGPETGGWRRRWRGCCMLRAARPWARTGIMGARS